jgi:hypothetical protein
MPTGTVFVQNPGGWVEWQMNRMCREEQEAEAEAEKKKVEKKRRED